MKKPPFRFVTAEAKHKLSASLGFPHSNCQDWEYTIGNPADIDKYIAHYKAINDDDQKFALMEIIIQATEEQESKDFDKYWNIINPLLKENFSVHEYSIYYWASFDNNLEDSWKISSLMRNFFISQQARS